MTAATLTHLPLAAGSAVATATGRAALLALAYYMRAPLTHTAIAAMAGLTLAAGSNALYFQTGDHPAPFYAPAERVASAPAPLPVLEPVERTASVPQMPAPAVTTQPPSQMASASSGPVGNEDVADVQRKLQTLGYFEGTIDGYYGPKTAAAIRAFENAAGLTPQGALNRNVVEAILAASPGTALSSEPLRPTEPAAETVPLMNYAPLTPRADVPRTVAIADTEQPVLQRQMPDTPAEALDIAVTTAGQAIDTIVAAVGSVAQPQPASARPAQAAALAPMAAAPTQRVASAPVMPVVPRTEPVATPLAQAASQPMPPRPAMAVPEADPVADIVTASIAEPAPVQTMAMTKPPAGTDQSVVAQVQRGLASLGFLHGKADGVAGEATARAIRNFEVYYNYEVTGQVTPELVGLLTNAGAQI